MAYKYNAFTNATNTTSTTVPLMQIGNSSDTTKLVRGYVYDLNVGSNATPADNYAFFSIRRTTARGTTVTSITPNALNGASAATTTVVDTTSTSPTITGSSDLLQWAQNQRATFRWVAAPGSELVFPSTASAGVGLMPVGSNATASYAYNIMWDE